jgi:hypothetical protein
VSIIDDLCADPGFKAKAEDAVKQFFEDNHQEEIRGKNGGIFDADVTKAAITLGEAEPDTVDGLSATVAVIGEASLEVQYMDEEGEDQEMKVDGNFDGTLSVEFPSDILASDDRDSLLSHVEIEEADLNFSAFDSEEE